MFKDIPVDEKKRSIYFKDGAKATFNNVKWFNSSGSYLRLGCDEGYAIVNSDNINYMIVPEEARVV